MQSLLMALGLFWIVQTNGLVSFGEEVIQLETFLEVYRDYITALKKGESLQDSRLRSYFSSAWTITPESLYAVQINPQQCLIKIQKPVIQLQLHRFDYSFADKTFRSMVMGKESISWGIQFSYPHLYQDEHFQVLTVKEEPRFPNTSLFKKLQQWVRANTIPTPFEVEGKKTNVPIRLGKECLNWINTYPQLKDKGLLVVA